MADILEEMQPVINQQLARYQVQFGLYKNGEFHERLFPFDPVAREISAENFAFLEKGLIQRVDALNAFIRDVYGPKKILEDGVVPPDFVFAGKGYLAQCDGFVPPKGIYSHISGIDLVEGTDGNWYILEDNLRIPSGASYPMIARELERRAAPDLFRNGRIADNRDYGLLLRQVMDYVNTGGINVIYTPGRYNAAYFEHSYLAEKTGATLAETGELVTHDGYVWYRGIEKEQKVGAIYRRIGDDFLDPLCFRTDSLIGIPGLMSVYRQGHVAIINAPGNAVADDKGIYYFVPKMIRYYLDQEPILMNAPTYLLYYEKDRRYVLDNLAKLVIKDVAEAGGYGVIFARDLSQEKLDQLRQLLEREPRRFIAQEIIDFKDLPILENGERVMRKADLRAFVLSGEHTLVWKSGLTRFSRNPDSFIVNSSQGGGFKDTWILCQK